MSTAHNDQELGKPLRHKKKRSAVFIVIIVSIAVHLLGLGGLAAIKIIEVLQPAPEFEAPPVQAIVTPPPPPPPPPPTTKRTQRSLPRPQPLAAVNPQSMSVPSINMQDSNLSLSGGRGMGGGLGELGGGMLDRVDFSFFGIQSTGNMVVLLDRSLSGATVFNRTRSEFLKTIEMMKQDSEARYALIYFGGNIAGQNAVGKLAGTKDPTKYDFWFPKGVRSHSWLAPDSRETEAVIRELNSVKDPSAKAAKVKTAKDLKKGKGAFFVLGTQYWGAFNAAYKMEPAPATIYFMVEPKVAFPSVKVVKESFQKFKKYGVPKPANTKVIFVVAKPKENVKNVTELELMVNLVHGGKLTNKEIQERIVY
ncbi:hypothetical protein SH580_21215 [Coraliomargarita algicola]|uniref:VWFA domain-containing protein n=1 Tax=Coraliomargarita algicola TaxID=3092156 RepID=A0ABZ0RIB3_9BACT|nr:hypothetical protein [Coraliomargarita sp. J2-16]WPJ95939.1 hypothetical protein SH580_21215 [Coraliomargarita sp. J2-16]